MKNISLTMALVTAFLVITMATLGSSSRTLQQVNSNVFNVLRYGARGDGSTDDSSAFLAAWTAACGAGSATILLVPRGRTYLLSPLNFQGPCKSSTIKVHVAGKIIAPDMGEWNDHDERTWIGFSSIDGLIVNGNGAFDGKGKSWWSKDSRPTALAFENCNNLRLSSLTHINSPRNHISIVGCNGVTIAHLRIYAPKDSPNTDGIDISRSTNVNIHDCAIGTGDDCIAINGGSAYINVTNVGCGPGHGISIGSLGEGGSTETVEEVHVRHCSFYKTMYGARIKSWQGGSGYARHISFVDIKLVEAENPIIIDQFYCNDDSHCRNETSAVQISNVAYVGFRGTSASNKAIQLDCSQTVGCRDIVLYNINITSANPNEALSSSCINAHGIVKGTNPVVNCLQT